MHGENFVAKLQSVEPSQSVVSVMSTYFLCLPSGKYTCSRWGNPQSPRVRQKRIVMCERTRRKRSPLQPRFTSRDFFVLDGQFGRVGLVDYDILFSGIHASLVAALPRADRSMSDPCQVQVNSSPIKSHFALNCAPANGARTDATVHFWALPESLEINGNSDT